MQKKHAFNGVSVKIMGRNELERLSRQGFAEGTFVVSIVDTDAPLVRITKRPAGLLRLAFDDERYCPNELVHDATLKALRRICGIHAEGSPEA